VRLQHYLVDLRQGQISKCCENVLLDFDLATWPPAVPTRIHAAGDGIEHGFLDHQGSIGHALRGLGSAQEVDDDEVAVHRLHQHKATGPDGRTQIAQDGKVILFVPYPSEEKTLKAASKPPSGRGWRRS